MFRLRPSSYENEICGTGHWLWLRRCDGHCRSLFMATVVDDRQRNERTADSGPRTTDNGQRTTDERQSAAELNHWTSCQPQTFGIVYRTATTTAKGFLGGLQCGWALVCRWVGFGFRIRWAEGNGLGWDEIWSGMDFLFVRHAAFWHKGTNAH